MDDLDYSLLPPKFQEGMRRWVEHAIQPGTFLSKVLDGDITAVLHADPETLAEIRPIIRWCYMRLPGPCWGSRLKTKSWRDAGGTEGIERMRNEAVA